MNPNVRKVLLDAPSLMVNGRVRYGQLAQCIALRPVAEGYNGNACTVRRSTDNTSQDVGFLGTELDNFSLMNFVGSENLLTYSEEMDNAIWIKAGLTITNNAAIAPDGTLTADLLSNTTAESIYQQTTLPAASIYSYSLYVKSASSDWIRFIVFESANSANQLTLWFNPSTGTLGTVSAGGTATLVTGNVVAAANGFYRIYLTGSFVTSLVSFQTNIVTANGGSTTATNSARYQWGAQVNLGTLQDYSRTVASPRQGSQNMLLCSEEFDNASWSKTDTTVTANAIVAPDGLTTADLLTEGSAGTATADTTFTASASGVAHTSSVYMKAGTSTGWVRLSVYETANATNIVNLWVNMATGALGSTSVGGTGVSGGGTTTTLLNGWYRISLSFTIAATALTMMTRSATADSSTTRVSGADRYQWGAQVNQGSIAAAYQKTVATTTEWGANQNLVTHSEGTVSQCSVALNVTNAGTSITGYANSIQLGDNSLARVLYKSYVPKSGSTYTVSVIVQMDDNSAPVVGLNNSSGDFCLVSSARVTTGTPVVTSLGGNVYRVSSSFVTPHTLSDWGVVKYTTQSSKGFRITGIQVNEGSVVQNYIRTLDKAIDVGNGYLTKIYDQSGNARDMSQATAANQPRIVFHGTGEKINGKAAFTTDGSTQQLTSTAFDLKQPFTRCGALQFTTIPSGVKGIFSDAAANGATLRVTVAGLLRMTTSNTDLNIKTGIVADDKAVTVEIYNSTATMGSYNRTVVATPVSSKLPDIPITQTRIGQDAGGYANVVVGEMIIFSQALSHSDRQTWEATAKQYWSTP